VIARNEEASIGRCLRSAAFADEMLVVENGSSDKTADIAHRCGARVISTPDWPGFGAQKNRALAAATGDWVLSLDADEWIEEDLAAEIKAAIAAPKGLDGYEIPRRSRFCGRVVRYCGWQPDYVLRLFRRDKGRFTNDTVHEKVKLSGRLGRLSTPIEHDSITDLDDAHDKIGRYSAAAAAQLIEKGARGSVAKALSHSVWAFLYTYLAKLGFLDGSVGVMVAAYRASYTYQKWARVAMAGKRRQSSSG
jgi:glycosyltransferase involved in cell wall biosynthesis